MLHVIVPIVVGGIIGYFTNYIAIKMLFRPRTAKYIGKWKVPFTPGVIPKNQSRIANAVGNAVSEQLLTKEAMMAQLEENGLSDKIAASIVDSILKANINFEESGETLEKAGSNITDKLTEEIEHADLLPVIREIGNHTLQDYLKNPMISMFLNGSMLESIYGKIDVGLKAYVQENGKQMVQDYIAKKVEDQGTIQTKEIVELFGMNQMQLTHTVSKIIKTFLSEKSEELLAVLDIQAIVQKQVESMKVEELEELVMYVMENELKAVINLGAVIGALIGMINIFL